MLDQEIIDVSGIVGLLLVFVTGYLAGLWPQVEATVRETAPESKSGKDALLSQLKNYRLLMWLVLVMDVGVLAVVGPLVQQVLGGLEPGSPYSALRAGMLLLALYQIILLVTVVLVIIRITKRSKAIRD